MMIIYVLDDGETWTMEKPVAVHVTKEQLERIENDEKVYNVVDDWDILAACAACEAAEE